MSPDVERLPGPPPRWRVRLLGDLEALDAQGGRIQRWPSRAVGLLLARLALAPARAHPREELVDALWPDASLAVGRNRLRQVLSTLKSLLEPPGSGAAVIVADRQAVRLVSDAISCDAVEFEACIRARRWDEARQRYRGPLLPGHFDEWVCDERQRLEALYERIPGADSPSQDPTLAPYARPAADDRAVADGPARTIDGGTLPNYLTQMHHAQWSLAQLLRALAEHRMVSLIGPGGVGKTRLSVEAAWRLAGASASSAAQLHGPATESGETSSAASNEALTFDLVRFVPLVGATSAAAVRDALGAALGCESRREAMVAALAGRRALLVLDNCEQVVAGAGIEAAGLLTLLPQLRLLATSRRQLGIDGEHVLNLAGLPLPDPGTPIAALAAQPAVALFVDRARLVRSDFHITAANGRAVAELVCWLGAMPLAIELAAARVRSLGPVQLLELLRHEPGTALELVARSGPRSGTDERHASMMNLVQWSWRLLSAPARELLLHIALFPAGCTLDCARAMVDGTAARTALQLDELVQHSLLRPADSHGRYAPYEVVREYALMAQDEGRAALARRAQRRWLMDWAASLPVTPPLDVVRAEMPNIVAVLGGCAADAAKDPSAPELAIEILVHMRRCFEDVELPDAGLRRLEAAIAACSDPARRAQGHSLIAGLLFTAGRGADALAHATRGLEGTPAADPVARARALHALASVGWRLSKDRATAASLMAQARELLPAEGAVDLQASLLALQAFVVGHDRGGTTQARALALHQQALQLWRQQGNRHAVNSGLYNLAVVTSRCGETARALSMLDEVIDSARRLQDAHRVRQALNVQGLALMSQRRWRDAVVSLQACVQQSWHAAAAHDLAHGLWNLPRALAHQREPERALRLMSFAAMHWQRHFGTLSTHDQRDLQRLRRLTGLALPAQRVERLWRDGEQLSLAEAVAIALERSERESFSVVPERRA